VAVVQDGTRPSQRTVLGRLDSIADDVAAAEIGAPAVVVIGGAAALRTQLRWFDTGALFGKRVLITRAGEQSAELARALFARGAQPVLAPVIAIVPVDDTSAARRAFQELTSYAWLIFTSQNGVDAFFARLAASKSDARAIGTAKVAAIGERTAARLRTCGVIADIVAAEFISEEIAREVIGRSRAGDRVLLYRAQEARDVLPQMLQDAGLAVTIVAAYTTVIPPDPNFALKVSEADVLTFTSASTVRGFVTLLGDRISPLQAASGKCVACIGPITASAAAQAGLNVDVVAPVHTTAGLLDALELHYAALQAAR
jgi:uroporphyrinogen III methyltransferase/synthase